MPPSAGDRVALRYLPDADLASAHADVLPGAAAIRRAANLFPRPGRRRRMQCDLALTFPDQPAMTPRRQPVPSPGRRRCCRRPGSSCGGAGPPWPTVAGHHPLPVPRADTSPPPVVPVFRSLDHEAGGVLRLTGGTTGAPKLAQHTHGNEAHTSWFAHRYWV